jgi:hypothetical protein
MNFMEMMHEMQLDHDPDISPDWHIIIVASFGT